MKIKLFQKLAVILAVLGQVSQAAENRQFDWLTNGVKSGRLELQIADDGSRTVHFQYNDRGRGPKITEVTHFDSNGHVIGLEISGNSYMGAAVNERMQVSNGQVSWKSTLEQGAIDRSAGFYLANDGTPEQRAILARALIANGGNVDLLPVGSARIEGLKVIERYGQASISLYRITGPDIRPHYIWLDDHQELFALIEGSMGLVPQGEAEWFETLKSLQTVEQKQYYQRLSRQLTQILPDRYLIKNVNVIDVDSGRVFRNFVVTVELGHITNLAPESAEFDGLSIDGQDGWLMPGLWDMHSHNRLEQGLLHLAAGVTTVRDLGNNFENLSQVREAFDQGQAIGPNIIPAGIVEGRSPFSAPIRQLASTEEEALEIVQFWAGHGYPQIKIYSSLQPAWVEAVVGKAHSLDMRVSGHVPAFMNAEQAVRQGFDEIQHIYFLFLNFLAGPEDDTRTPLRFYRIAEKAADLDLDSAEVKAFLNLLSERNVAVDPTVGIVIEMLTHRSGELSPSFVMIADHLPPQVRRGMLAGRLDIDEQNAGTYARSADAVMQMIQMLYQAGVRIVAGTDALAGFALHRELELYVEAGIPVPAVLRLATLGAAEHMGQAEMAGSIAPGKRADMVLLSANPLEDISAIRNAKRVFKGDRYYRPAQIYQAVGIVPFSD